MVDPHKLGINQTAVGCCRCGPQQITTAGSVDHGRTTARVSVIDNVVVP